MEINPTLLLSQVATFLIALFVVWKFGWGPLQKVMRDRQDNIRKTLENAEQTRQAVAKLEEDYKLRLQQIEQKSADLLALARAEGTQMRDQMMKKAQDEVTDLHKKAQEQLAFEREQLIRGLRQEIVGLSMSVAQKVLKEDSVEKLKKQRFEGILQELESGKEQHRAG